MDSELSQGQEGNSAGGVLQMRRLQSGSLVLPAVLRGVEEWFREWAPFISVASGLEHTDVVLC